MKTKVSLHRIKRVYKNRTRFVWCLRWWGTEIDPKTGEPKRYAETLGDCRELTKKKAEALRRKKQGEIDCKVIKPDKLKRTTLAELLAHDRESISGDARYRTLLCHDGAAKKVKSILGASTVVEKIGRPQVGKLKRQLREKGLRPASIDQCIRIMRAAWNRAKKDGLVHDNPWTGQSTKCDPRPQRIFSSEEIEAMIEVAPDDWWRLFIRLLATSGLRLNEALNLRWSDVDLDGGTVSVRRREAGSVEIEGRTYPMLAWSAKAKASYRTIPLPPETVAELARFKLKSDGSPYIFVGLERLAMIDARMKSGTWKPNSELVLNRLVRFKHIQKNAREWLAERRKVNLDKVPWEVGCIHDLRDTYLTGVKGLPLDVLQRIAGHSDIATTIRYYTGETARDADAVRDAVARSGLAGSVQDTKPDATASKRA